jgi:RNA recognition motif. (a.k.a. RRM, RBD, or RNP domain)
MFIGYCLLLALLFFLKHLKMNIYVGNISWNLKDQDLSNLFASYGEVTSAKIVTDKFTNRSKGFGFVEMADDASAQAAIAALNGTEVDGRNIVVRNPKVVVAVAAAASRKEALAAAAVAAATRKEAAAAVTTVTVVVITTIIDPCNKHRFKKSGPKGLDFFLVYCFWFLVFSGLQPRRLYHMQAVRPNNKP